MPVTRTKNWFKNTTLYQIYLGRWQSASIINHRNQVLNKLNKHSFNNLSENGFSSVYLMGLFDNRAPIVVKEENGQDLSHQPHRLPSPFALVDHTMPNLYLGKSRDIIYLIKSLHKQGLKVIVDFVPNHTSQFHPWTKLHPEYYAKHNDEFVSEFSGDVYKLDYANPQLREEMLKTLKHIASWDVDGVRCDMAHLVPNDFWAWAISTIKSEHEHFHFIAEAYSESVFDLSVMTGLLEAGFDAVYHEPLYRNLRMALEENAPIENVVKHVEFILTQPYKDQLVHYFANHDDAIIGKNDHYLEALLGLTLYLPGNGFVYNGSLNGVVERLAHHYYQDISASKLEPNYIPPALKAMLKCKADSAPVVDSISYEGGLIRLFAQLSDQSRAEIVVNLTPASLVYNFEQPKPGLIHQLTPQKELLSGQAEIFIG